MYSHSKNRYQTTKNQTMKNNNKENQKEKDTSKVLDMDGIETVKSIFLGNRKVVKPNAKDGDHLHSGLLD